MKQFSRLHTPYLASGEPLCSLYSMMARSESEHVMCVYLLHFERKLAGHAGHYCGYTMNLRARIAAHEAGDSAKLIEAISRNDIRFVVARVWEDGDRDLERKIKQSNNSPRLCPICQHQVHESYSVDVRKLTFQRAAPALEQHIGKRKPMH